MARFIVILALLVLPGCAVMGAAGTATVSDGRVDARASAASAGIGASGPYAGVRSGRLVAR